MPVFHQELLVNSFGLIENAQLLKVVYIKSHYKRRKNVTSFSLEISFVLMIFAKNGQEITNEKTRKHELAGIVCQFSHHIKT